MASTALVIHGVANRCSSGFATTVATLAELADIEAGRFHPVFWGALGPEGPLESVPRLEALPLESPVGAFYDEVAPTPELIEAARATALSTTEHLARVAPVGAFEAEIDDREMAEAIEAGTQRAAADGWGLALRPSVAPLLAELVQAGPTPAEAGVAAVGAFPGLGWVSDRIHRALGHAEDLIVDVLVDQFRGREQGLSGLLAHTVGDVLTYQSRGSQIRAVLDREFRTAQALGDEPIDIVAHSLGALAAVEWLLGAPVDDSQGTPTPPADRTIRHLVTFGCQVSMFAEVAGLRFDGPPDHPFTPLGHQHLDLALTTWTNVWQELDPLAFEIHRVIDIGDGTVTAVDRRLTQQGVPTDLSFHSSYWTDPRFARWLGDHLGG